LLVAHRKWGHHCLGAVGLRPVQPWGLVVYESFLMACGRLRAQDCHCRGWYRGAGGAAGRPLMRVLSCAGCWWSTRGGKRCRALPKPRWGGGRARASAGCAA